MIKNDKKQYFGVIKWYDTQKEFGVIQCHDIGDAGFKPINLKNADDITKLTKNTLAMFSIKKNKQGRNIAEKITFDYFQYIVTHYTQIANKTIDIILSYANDETKTKLQELISQKDNLTEEDLSLISEPNNLDFLNNMLKNNDVNFNANLIKTLSDGLIDIENENAFQNAKQLSAYNEQITGTYLPELQHIIYQKSTNHFKFRLWLEGVTDFCDLEIIKYWFNHADEALKKQILIRCNADESGFLINKNARSNNPNEIEDVYFKGIRDVILREIRGQRRLSVARLAKYCCYTVHVFFINLQHESITHRHIPYLGILLST